jgi:hypothetical protein
VGLVHGENWLFDLWNDRMVVRLDPPALQAVIVRASGRGVQPYAVPSLDRLVDVALSRKDLASEIGERKITPERLRRRLLKEAHTEVSSVSAKIVELEKATRKIHEAFKPAYEAAYTAVTLEFPVPFVHRVTQTLLPLPTSLLALGSAVAMSAALLQAFHVIKLDYVTSTVLIAAAIVYSLASACGLYALFAMNSLEKRYLEFLKQLQDRVEESSSSAQPVVDEYGAKRAELLRSVQAYFVPWLRTRIRRSPRISLDTASGASPHTGAQPFDDCATLVEPLLGDRTDLPIPTPPPYPAHFATNRRFVFLCHANEDKRQVRELHSVLCSSGLEPWFDEVSLLPGHRWREEIKRAIAHSVVVVVCLSKVSAAKVGIVQTEIRLALDIADQQPEGAIFIIPAKLEECEIPSRLAEWQWVDLFREDGIERLRKAIWTSIDDAASRT